MALFNAQYIEPLREKHKALKFRKKIKIAVLDSGLDYHDAFIKGAIKTRYITDRWSPTGTDWEDVLDIYGHGTHVTRLLLDTAPLAEICGAKFSRDKNLDESEMQVIANAIDWAVQTVNADIITMSFGMEKKLEEVAQKIKSALDHRKLVFAAASNGGGLAPRASPACLPGVICIHATDGYGNPATFNSTPYYGWHEGTATVFSKPTAIL
ncbi:Peptidase S8 [Metarhizium acridum CQMa 102]|uniref:Peptidase S8 n=1 Tax=Metarhizium acridum (strain CQMa 102) TaxID=655827 RepID=E9DX06_METAQ|nr:Peptidase S8 [Metarhizium acridum CQMa 102]EFY91869.1 Peptidase S8 [Metarhizium acridum CQMa 102]